MRYFINLNKYAVYTVLCLFSVFIATQITPRVYAQEADYFGGINVDSDGGEEIVLEIETNSSDVRDQMAIEPLHLKLISEYPANHEPNSKIVHIEPIHSGVTVKRGTVLQLDMNYDRPANSVPARKVLLWSSLQNPHYDLPSETLYALDIYPDEGDELDWKQTSHPTWRSSVDITKSASFTQHVIAGDKWRHTGVLQLQTAVLKPGNYHFFLKLYRIDNGETVETDIERFNFTIVDAPLHLVADIPASIPTYDEDKSAVNVRHTIKLSDWAVPPIKAKIRTNVPGITLDYGELMTKDLGEKEFQILLMPNSRQVGRTADFTLTIKDGIGRLASLKRSVKVTDGSNGEIKVDMASSVNAGQTITGTIFYPRGYRLLKEPFIGDRRGFEWTSSDYTSFRIKTKEEGVHYKRLFAIVTKGRVNGIDYEPVLTWKRTYDIKSQNLIYDVERNRRRTEANNKAWNDALSGFAAGVGAAASAYDEGGSDTAAGGTSSEGSSSSIQIGSSDVSGELDFSNGEPTNICGVDTTTGEWRAVLWDSMSYSDKFGLDPGVPGSGQFNQLRSVKITKKRPESGTTKYANMTFYAKNCVLKSQYTPRLDGYDVYSFWDNGGKEKEEVSGRYSKEWDRAGNLLEHWAAANGGVVCSNSRDVFQDCS